MKLNIQDRSTISACQGSLSFSGIPFKCQSIGWCSAVNYASSIRSKAQLTCSQIQKATHRYHQNERHLRIEGTLLRLQLPDATKSSQGNASERSHLFTFTVETRDQADHLDFIHALFCCHALTNYSQTCINPPPPQPPLLGECSCVHLYLIS